MICLGILDAPGNIPCSLTLNWFNNFPYLQDEAELVSAIQGLKENTSRIRQALDKNPKNIPEWLQAELRHCQSLLNNLL